MSPDPTPQDLPVPDVLGDPWTAETLHLDDGAIATLIRRPAAAGARPVGAVLLVHGFADYVFHAELGAWWAERGYEVYGLDLRGYGRSLRPDLLPTFVTDLAEHFPELDAAWLRITERDGHRRVLVAAHSTGGLTVPLWVDERGAAALPELAGLVLNSPWLDLRGSALLRTVGTAVIDRLGAMAPTRVIPREVNGVYGQVLHRDHGGEWDFDLAWKPMESFPVRVGWLRAVRRGHARLHRGLDVAVPVLVLSSDRTTAPTEVDEDARSSDVVLDVEQIRRWATAIGRHVTYVAVPGAVHDVVLSRRPARDRVYAEIEAWHDAHVERLHRS
ncbi:alpha/beta hydrolase [Nocardioides sp. TRM66260-LWL]|uniref:alpha/beta hydrolase n=1 Tax=Nocardioides sp. TRM66260-LWL TaxID=2874478 RepID=UPI001CC39C5D|nr:alpha/beta hydrolase [Nocardioides sp. TRM66260-LWL]MBZ5733932.1 alpha/beta hydrolase [Nocardioides sp. TRM66260-LWL]